MPPASTWPRARSRPSNGRTRPCSAPTCRARWRALKAQPGPNPQIIGSGGLIQSLQATALIDEYNVWTFPVVLGHGKRLFEPGARPCAMKLLRSQVSTTGVVMSTYVPAGEVPLGSFAQTAPKARELERRANLAREAP